MTLISSRQISPFAFGGNVPFQNSQFSLQVLQSLQEGTEVDKSLAVGNVGNVGKSPNLGGLLCQKQLEKLGCLVSYK